MPDALITGLLKFSLCLVCFIAFGTAFGLVFQSFFVAYIGGLIGAVICATSLEA